MASKLVNLSDRQWKKLLGPSYPGGVMPGIGRVYDVTRDRYLPRMRGGALGISDSRDVLWTLDQVTLDVVWDDMIDAITMYNEALDSFLGPLTFRTRQSAWRIASGGRMKWQKGTQYGRPDRQRIMPTFTTRGLPVWDYDLGLAYTRKYLLNATAQEIEMQQNEVFRSDNENLLNEVLRAAFRNTSYQFDDDRVGTITVLPAYNGDSEVPPPVAGHVFTAPHTHYHVTNGAWEYADILLNKSDLREHGHDGRRILRIAENLEPDIRAMQDANGNSAFVENFAYENPFVALAPADTQRTTVGLPPEYIGVIAGFWVRVDPWLPDNYYFGYNDYGANSTLAPLAFREPYNDAEVGLQLIEGGSSAEYPIVNSYYLRSFGVAALNRGNLTVTFVDSGSSYVDPTASFPEAT